ncbi:3'-5' exonuclease [uncultured Desulfovibrio sp.]|uniref:3'-5' exonuclease n=1 Tax=uncultured Desulfovibrio sp. TaxID=167968 RepID=UPI002634595C|nr:3'-5' exonuclease [uncultured Desulfovibrio sp.]
MNLEELRRRLSSDEINALPLRHYEGPIYLVRNEADWRNALPQLLDERVIGFDTETRPTFRKGRINQPSLVQLATADAVYLVQLGWLPFGDYLADLLADGRYLKVGVGIGDDMRELGKIHPFTPAGHVDLGQMARQNRMCSQGLRSLTAHLFGWRISKGPQCSNWGLPELTQRQILYAATDAWVGRAIFLKMCELGLVRQLP